MASLDASQIERHGIVLERNLHDATTYSIGQVCVGELVGSYYGIQRTTLGNGGEACCYGGSDLVVVRGGYADR